MLTVSRSRRHSPRPLLQPAPAPRSYFSSSTTTPHTSPPDQLIPVFVSSKTAFVCFIFPPLLSSSEQNIKEERSISSLLCQTEPIVHFCIWNRRRKERRRGREREGETGENAECVRGEDCSPLSGFLSSSSSSRSHPPSCRWLS